MVSKKFVVLFFLLFASVFMVGVAQAGWHEWSQGARNVAILEEAYKDINKPVGLNCKEWARKVVQNASGGLITLPATVDPPGWYWSPHQYVASRSGGRIESAQVGEIVQMDLKNYVDPHTAIVLAISKYGVTFVESNCCDNNCEVVRTQYINFSAFYQQVHDGCCFTINKIL